MLKVILPVILVLMALAATEFVLRYDEVLTGVFTRIQEGYHPLNEPLETYCF